MQYKKDNVRNKIIEVARQEFLEKGFLGTGIKVIASNAGVPIGNLYRYFGGKSELLAAIVSPVYNEIPEIIDKVYGLFVLQKPTFAEAVPILSENILYLFDKYESELIILTYRCEGTEYGDFIDRISEKINKFVFDALNPTEEQKEFLAVVNKSFIDTLLRLLRDTPKDNLKPLISKLIEFTFGNIDRI